MDLFDRGTELPEGAEPFMKRYFKLIVIGLSAAIALCLTLNRRGAHGPVGFGAGETLDNVVTQSEPN